MLVEIKGQKIQEKSSGVSTSKNGTVCNSFYENIKTDITWYKVYRLG